MLDTFRRLLWSHRAVAALALAAALLCALALWGERALREARPAIAWTWNPATNRLVLTAISGKGPLAGSVFRRTRWSATLRAVDADAREVLQLSPGQRWSGLAALSGPEPAALVLRLKVPPAPRYSVLRLTDSQLEIRSSEPLERVEGIPASEGTFRTEAASVVVLDRRVAPKTVHLTVQAASGERAEWDVTVPGLPEVPVVWFGPSAGGQVYLTIDDGWYPNQRLLRLMRQYHVPVMAFLIERAVAEHPQYWRQFVEAGGVIEDHTVSHPNLTQISYASDLAQWSGPVADYPRLLSVPAPTLGRPPFGAYGPAVAAAAHAAGLKEIVMWDVQWLPGKGVRTWNGGPIAAGDIILLHFVPGVGRAVQELLPELAKAHLHPSLLAGAP